MEKGKYKFHQLQLALMIFNSNLVELISGKPNFYTRERLADEGINHPVVYFQSAIEVDKDPLILVSEPKLKLRILNLGCRNLEPIYGYGDVDMIEKWAEEKVTDLQSSINGVLALYAIASSFDEVGLIPDLPISLCFGPYGPDDATRSIDEYNKIEGLYGTDTIEFIYTLLKGWVYDNEIYEDYIRYTDDPRISLRYRDRDEGEIYGDLDPVRYLHLNSGAIPVKDNPSIAGIDLILNFMESLSEEDIHEIQDLNKSFRSWISEHEIEFEWKCIRN